VQLPTVKPSATTTAPERAAAHPGRLFYGWLIVAAGMGIQCLQGALLSSSYGAYVVLMQADYAWSRTVFAGAYSLQQVESGVLGPVQGWLIDRFGPRAVMRVGVLLFGVGFMLFSRIESIPAFYAVFLMMAVGTSLSGFFPLAVTIVNWFHKRRATAMGIMSTGSGIGGLIVPAVAWSLNTHGWRGTAFASGLLIILLGLPLTQLVRHKPEPYGYLPDGAHRREDEPGRPAPARREVDFTVRQALRTRAFWCVSLGHASALLVVSAVMVHLVSFLNQSLNFTVAQGAAVMALVTGSMMVGQVSGGFLGDRLNKRMLIIFCMFGHASAFILLAAATAVWMVLTFAVLHGLSWGVRGPLMQVIRGDYFGRASYGTIMGFSSVLVMLGTVSGPLVAAVLADQLGNYRFGFALLGALAGLGSIFWMLATPPQLPQPPVAPS
jgi:sugar phosphate permease